METQSYSLIELNQIKRDVDNILEQKEEFALKFVYGLVKNKSVLKSEIEAIREKMKEDEETFKDFQREVFELYRNHGADIEPSPQGGEHVTSFENMDIEKFKEDKEKLDEKYKETIAEQEETNKYNQKIAEEKVATPDWYKIPFEALPEKISGKHLTENILLFIKE